MVKTQFENGENPCVNFTNNSKRKKCLTNNFRAFLCQTICPEKVYICIPYFSKRFEQPYVIPSNLETYVKSHNDVFEIIRCEEDYGPATKLLGCIEKLNKMNKNSDNDDCSILVCDDDRKPSSTYIENFLKHKNESDGVTIFTGKFSSQPGLSSLIKVAWGFTVILFPIKIIDSDIIDYFHQLCPECQYVDDVFWYKYFLELKQRKFQEIKQIRMSSEKNGADALYKEKGAMERIHLQKQCFLKKIKQQETLLSSVERGKK